MARHRFHAPDFIRPLETSPQPIYVLDAGLSIVFLNEACRTWLGTGAEELPGRRCVYRAVEEAADPDAMAARLCPPPVVLEGREVTADIVGATGQTASFRRVRFVPLCGADAAVLCVVALVDPQDRNPDDAASTPQQPPDEALELHRLLQRLRRETSLRHGIDRLAGVSPAIRRARAQAEVAAATRANVLLLGPPGSGRRRLAEAIHYGGDTERHGALVPLECGLLDADLIQSTVRSAVSGPARGGTLLFCDAEQIPEEIQASLAAVIAGTRSSWRAISTTSEPLLDLPPRGRYRDDLASLLSTIVIELPPLARRREDLPLLAQALLEEQNGRGKKQLAGFTAEAMDRLCGYHWPGNLDELAGVVIESHARAAGPHVARDDLPELLRLAAEAAARPRRKEETIQLDEFMAHIERELIRRALTRAKGNKSEAAKLLGLNRQRLLRRMTQLGLAKEEEME